MSVATKNPFALLEAEDSSRPSSPVKAPAPAAAAPAAPTRGTNAQRSRGGPAARGGKYYQRGGAKSAGPRSDEPSGNLNQNGIDDAPQDKKFEGGRGRGGRGGRGGNRGGRGRQFDKHSQTGKVDTEKKINQGWGADEGNAELKAEEAAANDATAEAANAPAGGEWGAPSGAGGDWGAEPGANAASEWATDANAPAGDDANAGGKPEREGRPRREREPEEEDNTLTLEQYLAQQKEKDSIVPKLEGARQVDDGNWKDVVPLQKGEEDAYFVGKTKSAAKPRTKKEEKVYLEIDARFERPSRGGRGGRGGDDRGARGARGSSGGRGRGGQRGGRGGSGAGSSTATFDVDDQKAFPSLS